MGKEFTHYAAHRGTLRPVKLPLYFRIFRIETGLPDAEYVTISAPSKTRNGANCSVSRGGRWPAAAKLSTGF